MVDSIVDSVFNLFENFTIKRFFALCVTLGIFLFAVLMYEKYTSNFQLNRLQKSAEILNVLQGIEPNNVSPDKELLVVYNNIKSELSSLSDPTNPTSLNYIPPNAGLLKFLLGFLPWALMSLALLPQFRKKEDAAIPALFLLLVLALVFGWIGYLMPTVLWPWFNLVFYPLGHITLFIAPAIIIPQFKAYRRRAEEVRQERNMS